MGRIEPSDAERYPHLLPAAMDIARFRELPDLSRHFDDLAKWKERAVKTQGDEFQAKTIWCLEGLVAVHTHFASAHNSMRSGDVVDAFDRIEGILTATHEIRRHLYDADGRFGLDLIHNIALNWVTLLDPPYGISHGSIIKRAYCSICQTKVGVRWPCGHIKGEIYGGDLCIQIVAQAELAEVSMVERPASLLLINHKERMLNRAGKLRELAETLPSPYTPWFLESVTDLKQHPAYRDVGRNAKCPCGSGKKLKRCCTYGHPKIKHWDIQIINDYKRPIHTIDPPRRRSPWGYEPSNRPPRYAAERGRQTMPLTDSAKGQSCPMTTA